MNFKVLLETPDDRIHGQINFVAPLGFGVMVDPTDLTKLKAASGRGHALMRDSVAEVPLSEHVFNTNFVTPIPSGTEGTARRVIRAEVEGADLLAMTGTGALTTSTAANTALSYLNGKLREKQSSDELAGWLRAQLTPETDGNARILVEFLA